MFRYFFFVDILVSILKILRNFIIYNRYTLLFTLLNNLLYNTLLNNTYDINITYEYDIQCSNAKLFDVSKSLSEKGKMANNLPVIN